MKKLDPNSIQGEKEFLNELKLLSRVKGHRNIVSIVGYASDDKQHCLLTPFCPAGSLQDALAPDAPDRKNFLAPQRLEACLDVACGLQFLHANSIWHLDLKPG